MPLPPLSLSEAPHPFGGFAFPQLHISRLESVAGVARLPRFISGGVACSASQLDFPSTLAAAALQSSQTWICVLFNSTEPSAGQPP